MRIELDVWRTPTGRPEGTIHAVDGGDPQPFVGTLDLLRRLEDLTGATAEDRVHAPSATGIAHRSSGTAASGDEQEGWA